MSKTIATKFTALTMGALIALPVAVAPIEANAGQRHWHGGHHHHKPHRKGKRKVDGGELLAVGILGLAVGAIIADSNRNRQHRADHIYHTTPSYVPPQPVSVYQQPYPTYYRSEYPNYDPVYSGPVPAGPPVALHQPQYQPQYRTLPNYQRQNAPVAPKVITYDSAMSGGSLEPWSNGWKQYCRSKYRSFNAKSGTFLGYDGKRHFCVVK